MRKFDVILIKKDIDTTLFGKHMQNLIGRPCVVVSNDMNNKYSHNVNIVPLSTKIEKKYKCHALVTDSTKKESIALCEQIFTIDKKFIHKVVSHLDEKSKENVIKAITEQLLA